MSRMERLEEAFSHQQQQSARMERLEEAMSQQQQSAGGMLTSGGVSQVSEQWQHNVGRTPSGDGALPPSLHVMGLTSFSAPSGAVSTDNVGSLSQQALAWGVELVHQSQLHCFPQ